MKYILLTLIVVNTFFISCSGTDSSVNNSDIEVTEKPTADEAYDRILDIEANVISPNNVVSNSKLLELKRACENFNTDYYNDKRTEAVLQKAIRASVSLKNYADAIKLMDKVIKNYGTEEKMPGLLFQKAFIYSESNWLGEADKIYTRIIKEYPNDPLAEQAKAAQEILYLSPEELNAKFSTQQ